MIVIWGGLLPRCDWETPSQLAIYGQRSALLAAWVTLRLVTSEDAQVLTNQRNQQTQRWPVGRGCLHSVKGLSSAPFCWETYLHSPSR